MCHYSYVTKLLKPSLIVGIVLIVLLALPGIWDLFKPGYYSSHDGVGHVIRMDEFYHAFIDGQIPVRWSKRLYFGYGYPFFNFNYPLVYYLGLPLMLLGFAAEIAMKAETMGMFVLSGILMFLYLVRKVRFPFAVLGAVLYLYAPYRMSNMYVRGSVAEAMAFIYPPLLLWCAELLSGNSRKSIFFAALVIGFLGFSHNISALLLYGFFFFYLFILALQRRSVGPLVKGGISFGLGLLMAGFFFIPALTEKKLTFLDQTIARDYPDHFLEWYQLIKGGWGFGGSVRGPNDGMSFNLGWIHVGLAVLAIVFLIRNLRRLKHLSNLGLVSFCLIIIAGSIFFMLPVSKLLWDKLPLLPFVQFPWRFTMLTVPVFAVLGAIGVEEVFRKIGKIRELGVIVLISLTLFLAKDQWHRNQTEYVHEISGDALEGTTTWAGEQATKWLVPKPNRIPQAKVEGIGEIGGYGRLNILSWKTGYHQYQIQVGKDGKLVEHTMYYPGWKVWVDGQEAIVDYQDKHYPGQLVFPVPRGSHLIVSKFTETPQRFTFDIISLITFALLIIGLWKFRRG